MRTTWILIGGVLAGAAIATAVIFAFQIDFGEGSAEDAAPSPSRPTEPEVSQPAARLAPAAPADLAALQLTEDEIHWVRERVQEERRRVEMARVRPADTGLDVLRRVLEHGADARHLLADFEAFSAPVKSSASSPVRVPVPASGDVVKLGDYVADGALIVLGPGTYRLDPDDVWGRGQPGKAVSSLEIRGAGMDATRLIAGHVWALIGAQSRLENLRMRDLTLDGGDKGGSLLDVRGRTAAIFENVRVAGWLVAGHAAAIGVSGNAYLGCRGCEFIGRGARSGYAVSLRGDALVLLDSCRFVNVTGGAVIASGSEVERGGVTLTNSTFEASRLADRKPTIPLRVRGAVVRFGSAELTPEERQERWGAGYADVLENATFEAPRTTTTLKTLVGVLERLRLPYDEQVLYIEVYAVEGEQPTSYRVGALAKDAHRAVLYSVDVSRGLPDPVLLEDSHARGVPALHTLREALPLEIVVRKAGVPLDLPTTALDYQSQGSREGPPFPTVRLGSWYLDARDGSVIRRP